MPITEGLSIGLATLMILVLDARETRVGKRGDVRKGER